MTGTVGVIRELEAWRERISAGEEEGNGDVLPHKYRGQWWSVA